jgi:GT2 family glycosyltransferase
MYCEEVDWSVRIRRAGWEIYTVPQARITHLEGKSSSQIRPQSIINLWSSRLRLYSKYYSPLKQAIARRLVRLGMQRKLRQVERDVTLDGEQRQALITTYDRVIELYRKGINTRAAQ